MPRLCHQQVEEGKGTGNHCHLIVSKIVGGKVFRELQRKGTTALLKQAFTTAVGTHVGISIDEYRPHQLNRGRRLEKWQYESRKMEDLQKENQKLVNKLDKQIERWEVALEKSDIKQLRRQRNRIKKTFSELDGELESSVLSSRISNILNQ